MLFYRSNLTRWCFSYLLLNGLLNPSYTGGAQETVPRAGEAPGPVPMLIEFESTGIYCIRTGLALLELLGRRVALEYVSVSATPNERVSPCSTNCSKLASFPKLNELIENSSLPGCALNELIRWRL